MAYTSSEDAFLTGDDRIISRAKRRFRACEEWEGSARANFEYDYKFANGDSVNNFQWDSWVVGDRVLNDRPTLTINKTMQHCLQIINDGKQNKPGVNIRPVGDTASFEAAQIFQEVVRHIEYISYAETIYDSASTFQVIGGIGYWHVTTDYLDDTSSDQEIFIRRIKDPRSVYLDPDINEVDGSDATFGFIFSDMHRDLYDAKYPNDTDAWGTGVWNNENDGWYTKDHIRVAKYYEKTLIQDKYVSFTLEHTQEPIEGFLSELPKEAKEYFADLKRRESNLPTEMQSYRERKVTRGDIMVYKIAGNKIIEKSPWLGKYIPIVRIVGTETVIDGVLDRKGHVRALLDPQRIYNVNSPLALTTKLPTPTGWTTMWDVKAGDWLLDENGKPVEVADTSPIFINRDCYRIEFDDGSHIVADADHQWTVEEREKIKTYNWTWPTKTIPTKELMPNKHFIWATKPLDLEEKDLPIHPYVLGAWLGDGTSASAQFTAGADDVEEMRQNILNCGYTAFMPRATSHGAYNFTVSDLRWRLINAKLLNNKHIPKEYLRASREQRFDLLRGLLDTDGCFSPANNRCIFTNTNMSLLEDFTELLRSLGIRFVRQNNKANSRMFPNGKTYECVESAHISFTISPDIGVFKLKRKLELQTKDRVVHERRSKRHRILSVTKVSTVPVKCVCINSDSHLFLAGEGMIPTHNSANVEYGALQAKTPITAASAAIEGYEEYYRTANTVNHAWMPYNQYDEDGNKLDRPERMQPPQPGAAYVQQMQIAQNEMMMVSGQYQAQMGENENAKSGIAITQRQRQGERATFHFIDGQAIGVNFTGKILIDLIPKIYDTKRIMQIEAKDGTVINLTIDPEATEAYTKVLGTEPSQSNEQMINVIFNPNVGRYTVQADTGPSFATRRQEAFNALTQIAAQNKEFMGIAGDILWKVADFPEAQLLAQRWRRVIPPNISGDAPNPQMTAAMEQASQKIEEQLATIAKMQQELDSKNAEIAIKEREVTLKEKVAGHTATVEAVEQIREDFRALNERFTAVGNAGPAFSIEQLQPIIENTIREALANAGVFGEDVAKAPGIGEGGTPVETVIKPETEVNENG